MSFNPDVLNSKPTAQKTEPSKRARLVIVVDDYAIPSDGFHYAIGHKFDNPNEKVRVRLNTVDERAKDVPRQDRDKIEKQYKSGENTRDTIADKLKANIKLLSFDDAVLLNTTEGITEYRAHWAQTMSTDPSAEVVSGIAHIRLREMENAPSQAYVEMVKGANVATSENIDQLLHEALAIKDKEGRARDPFMAVRVIFQDKVHHTSRLYPAPTTKSVFDQDLGRSKDISVPMDAADTISHLMSGAKHSSKYATGQADTIRAIVAGLKGLDVPDFNGTNQVKDTNLYHGVKGGHLKIEVISFEKLDFGPDSRKTYLLNKSRPHLKSYDLVSSREGSNETSITSGYTESVVAFVRHPDGEPLIVFASPTEMWPEQKLLKDIPLEVLAKPVIDNELSSGLEAEQEANATPTPKNKRESKKDKSADNSSEGETLSM